MTARFVAALGKLGERYQERPDRWDPFISRMVFVRYKRIKDGENIVLDWPVTALVGKNGSNKSSILHALYGAPRNLSPGRFWFSTQLDPIDEANRPRYFYEYPVRAIGATAQVRKMMYRAKRSRGAKGKARDPDYWEPTQPAQRDGMDKFVRLPGSESMTSGDRWDPVDKEVVYLDLRSDLAAFDKLYFSETEANRIRAKRRIRGAIKPLRKVLGTLQSSFLWYRAERVRSALEFDSCMLEATNYVLGQSYARIKYAEHSFFGFDGYTFLFSSSDDLTYSDAFAGRGEASVARIIYRVASAIDSSLILLDEPETSLHTQAQRRLVEVLAHYALAHGHQIVFATHSQFMLEALPREAVKFCIPQTDGTVAIQNKGTSIDSMFYLGGAVPRGDVTTIFVEDGLSKFVVQNAIDQLLDEAARSRLQVQVLPGGVDTIRANTIPAHLRTDAGNQFVYLLDGDVLPPRLAAIASQYPSSADIPESCNGTTLKSLVADLLGTTPKPALDGSSGTADPDREAETYRALYDFVRERVFYLPFDSPETALFAVLEGAEAEALAACAPEANVKERIRAVVEVVLCDPKLVKADSIDLIYRSLWAKSEDRLSSTQEAIVEVLENAGVI